MDETRYADVVYVMHKGTITLSGTPKEVFTNVDEMIEAGLDVPQSTRLLYELKKEGIKIENLTIEEDETADILGRLLK